MTYLGECKSCRAPIQWTRTAATNSRMMLDREPVENGNTLVDAWGRSHVFKDAEAASAAQEADVEKFPDSGLYVSHFVTCEYAPEHRAAKAKEPEAVQSALW